VVVGTVAGEREAAASVVATVAVATEVEEMVAVKAAAVMAAVATGPAVKEAAEMVAAMVVARVEVARQVAEVIAARVQRGAGGGGIRRQVRHGGTLGLAWLSAQAHARTASANGKSQPALIGGRPCTRSRNPWRDHDNFYIFLFFSFELP
jgi:hypothetical protein